MLDLLSNKAASNSILHFAAAVGYVAADFSRGFLDAHNILMDVGYCILAAVYFVDAVMYWFSWSGAWPHPDGVAIAAEYMNMIASFGYVVTSVFYVYESGPDGAFVFSAVLIVETVLAALFVVDALAYTWAWYSTAPPVPHRGCSLRDLDLWVNVLNVVPSLLVLMASVLGVWMHWTQTRAAQEHEGGNTGAALSIAAPGTMTPAIRAVLKRMAQVSVLADVLFVVDALFSQASWFRDLRLEAAPWAKPAGDLVPIYPLPLASSEAARGASGKGARRAADSASLSEGPAAPSASAGPGPAGGPKFPPRSKRVDSNSWIEGLSSGIVARPAEGIRGVSSRSINAEPTVSGVMAEDDESRVDEEEGIRLRASMSEYAQEVASSARKPLHTRK